MRTNILIAFTCLCIIHNGYSQDSLSIKMNSIDEYKEKILTEKKEFFSIGFPLKWYTDNDSIHYYFKDNRLVFIEHYSNQKIDGDTWVIGAIYYRRVFFMQNKLALEEQYSKSFEEHYRWDENNKGYIDIYNNIRDKRNYYDFISDKRFAIVSRSIEAPETQSDSLLNLTEWHYLDISKYNRTGKGTFRRILKEINENEFTFPDSLIMPYSEE